MEDLETEMTYDPELETDLGNYVTPTQKRKNKKNKNKKQNFNRPVCDDLEKESHPAPKEEKTLRLRAVKNFMLWDKTMVREGEVVDVSKLYAERLLTHTPKAFERA